MKFRKIIYIFKCKYVPLQQCASIFMANAGKYLKSFVGEEWRKWEGIMFAEGIVQEWRKWERVLEWTGIKGLEKWDVSGINR